jgi:hypothetical protein
MGTLRRVVASVGAGMLLVSMAPPATADVVPTVVPGLGTVVEGHSGVRVAEIPVRLSEPSAETVTVDWRTVPSDEERFATEGADYVADSGTVTIPPGALRGDALITVLGDTAPEGDEQILVEFSNPETASSS